MLQVNLKLIYVRVYMMHLFGENSSIIISAEFKDGLTASDLLKPGGTITFQMKSDNFIRSKVVLFDLRHDDFKMEIKSGTILLHRGEDQVSISPILDYYSKKLRIFAMWVQQC